MSERNLYADHALAMRYLLVDRERVRGDRFEYDRLASELNGDGYAVAAILGHITTLASTLLTEKHGDEGGDDLLRMLIEGSAAAQADEDRNDA
ncbi:hypothetical protein MPY17_25310 [Rhodococcus opacus]|uniref:hypothetical protein n=1 Tax=Rhodococcus opacus TaxID=37919 RepID=UPI001FF24930|nr:hypothetical protein [Rhodococcus opacus]UOT02270.1 hypothetical protein MPY17_25310 [Rhodococcus opacus]